MDEALRLHAERGIDPVAMVLAQARQWCMGVETKRRGYYEVDYATVPKNMDL